MVKKNSADKSFEEIAYWLEIYHSVSDIKEKSRVKTLIVTHMYPIVKRIARTIARRATDPIEDLIQAGFIGLLKAIDKYKVVKNDNFKIYAGYLIIGEIKHYIRDNLNTIKVPRYIQELSIRIHNFTKTLTYEELESLTNDEVAFALKVSPNAVDYAIEMERRRTTFSLEDVFRVNNDVLNYEEVLAEENYEERASYEDSRIIFENIINKLPPEEKIIIDMYYNQNMKKSEIAKALLITPMMVTRKMKQAFELIAKLVSEDEYSNRIKLIEVND